MTAPRRHAFGLKAGALLALLAGYGLAPPAAHARCGDYVLPRHADARPAPPAETRPAAPVPHDPKPCHGPLCSTRHQTPTPAPAPAPTSVVEQWAWLTPAAPPAPSAGQPRPPDGPSLLPVPPGASVYHPPR
jgi:hypothetical protein